MKKLRNGLAVAALGAVVLVGCGGADDATEAAEEKVEEAQDAADEAADAADEAGEAANEAADDAAEAAEEAADAANEAADAAEEVDGMMDAEELRQQIIDQMTAAGLTQEQAECVADEVKKVVGDDVASVDQMTPEQAQEMATAQAACITG